MLFYIGGHIPLVRLSAN